MDFNRGDCYLSEDCERTPEEIWKEIFSTTRPFPSWFRKMMQEGHTFDYRGLKIPQVKLEPRTIGRDEGSILPGVLPPIHRSVGVGFNINGFPVPGWVDTVPEFHSEKLTKDQIKSGFIVKFSKAMRYKYGDQFKKDPKKCIEDGLGIKVRGKIKRSKRMPLKWIKIGKAKTFSDLLKGK